jgi:YVTN family beta-propeller protein
MSRSGDESVGTRRPRNGRRGESESKRSLVPLAFPVVAATILSAIALSSGSLGAPVPQLAPIAASETLRTSGAPAAVAIDGQTGRAYVTDSKENTLYVFDAGSADPVAYVPTGRQPNQVVLTSGRAFVSNFGDASITVVDTTTNHAVKTFAVGGLGLAVNPKTERVYAAAGSRVWVLDPGSDTPAGTLEAPAGARLWGVAVDPATNRIYASDALSARLLIYDGATNKLITTVGLDAPARLAMAIGPLGRVYVTSYTDQNPQLSVIDGLTGKVITRVPTNAFATAIAVDAKGLAYAPGTTERSVVAIDPAARGASTKVAVSQPSGAVDLGPSVAVAISPRTGGVVVATAGGAAPPPRSFDDAVRVVRP